MEDGSCACGARVGKGRSWSATRERGRWQMRFVLEDKLNRPFTYEAEVRADDVRGTAMSGTVRSLGGARRASSSSSSNGAGTRVVGEFSAFKLE